MKKNTKAIATASVSANEVTKAIAYSLFLKDCGRMGLESAFLVKALKELPNVLSKSEKIAFEFASKGVEKYPDNDKFRAGFTPFRERALEMARAALVVRFHVAVSLIDTTGTDEKAMEEAMEMALEKAMEEAILNMQYPLRVSITERLFIAGDKPAEKAATKVINALTVLITEPLLNGITEGLISVPRLIEETGAMDIKLLQRACALCTKTLADTLAVTAHRSGKSYLRITYSSSLRKGFGIHWSVIQYQ